MRKLLVILLTWVTACLLACLLAGFGFSQGSPIQGLSPQALEPASQQAPAAPAQILNARDFRIEWKVINRFRLFKDEADFERQEQAWKQYLLHVDGQPLQPQAKQALITSSSVLGVERVLNDRFIAFTRNLRRNFDWRGWAAETFNRLCWNPETRRHDACGGSEAYVYPKSHDIEAQLIPNLSTSLIAEYNCEWRIGAGAPVKAPCDQPVRLSLAYPDGGDISVNVEGGQPIMAHALARDLLIAGLGDSFGSGEGNPDVPVQLSAHRRSQSLYPARAVQGDAGNAQWLDRLCHRSLYSHQLRAALQIGIENPHVAVTFLGYACSGAEVDEGILGPQKSVERVATGGPSGARYVEGGDKDGQLYRLLRETCAQKPRQIDDNWICPDKAFRRPVDYLLLSIGGNDIGFSNVVAWATLRSGTSSTLAKWFGATVDPEQFADNMQDVLPQAYAQLAKAFAASLPLYAGEPVFDPGRVILTAYPDILVDEKGEVCKAGGGDDDPDEDSFPANQSLDGFSAWLETTSDRLGEVHAQLQTLHQRMKAQAGDLGWTFAVRVYQDKLFTRHGFCARSEAHGADPSEMLLLPCWQPLNAESCKASWGSGERHWSPYNPATENYPYALRQRWVRSFNDAYLVINEKVLTKAGAIDESASAQTFSEATGAMHPSAEGQAAMADAILMDLRAKIARDLEPQ